MPDKVISVCFCFRPSKLILKHLTLSAALEENVTITKLPVCYSKKLVPRAGTSGFRAPEVLIHCPHQTTGRESLLLDLNQNLPVKTQGNDECAFTICSISMLLL